MLDLGMTITLASRGPRFTEAFDVLRDRRMDGTPAPLRGLGGRDHARR
jgi:hypothetical protein